MARLAAVLRKENVKHAFVAGCLDPDDDALSKMRLGPFRLRGRRD